MRQFTIIFCSFLLFLSSCFETQAQQSSDGFSRNPNLGQYLSLLRSGEEGLRILSEEYVAGTVSFEIWLQLSYDVMTRFDSEEKTLQQNFEDYLLRRALGDEEFKVRLISRFEEWGFGDRHHFDHLSSSQLIVRKFGYQTLKTKHKDIPPFHPGADQRVRAIQLEKIRLFLGL